MNKFSNVNRTQAPATDTKSADKGRRQQADAHDVDKFKESMNRQKATDANNADKHNAERSANRAAERMGKQANTHSKDREKQDVAQESGEAALHSLFRQSIGKSEVAGTGSVRPDPVEHIVERVLVAKNELSGTSEVRLTISQDVLPGTEISIKRDSTGIHVSLMTTDEGSLRLMTSQQENLHARLAERLQEDVFVDVKYNDPNQDGRSRNRRNLFDEQDED